MSRPAVTRPRKGGAAQRCPSSPPQRPASPQTPPPSAERRPSRAQLLQQTRTARAGQVMTAGGRSWGGRRAPGHTDARLRRGVCGFRHACTPSVHFMRELALTGTACMGTACTSNDGMGERYAACAGNNTVPRPIDNTCHDDNRTRGVHFCQIASRQVTARRRPSFAAPPQGFAQQCLDCSGDARGHA